MSLGFLRFVLSQALSPCPLRPVSLVASRLARSPSTLRPACSCHFSTDTEGGSTSVSDFQKETKKSDPRARVTFASVGRKIGQRHIQLLGEDGEELGTMHRADVIRLMDETGLRLVAINDDCDPPLYRLMKGKQIHEEQMKLRDTQKAKKGPVQSKELIFSSDISLHDLDTKLRQVVSWLEKNNHVRLTIRARTDGGTPLDKVLTQMVERISVPVGFVSKPSVVRGGRAAMCVLRLASAKELQKRAETSNKNLKHDSETPASLHNSNDFKQQ
ncbi:translation initiation factor IF-3, mitochondrial [Carassius auratus]|uniref:Translation initiation factor IF-3, mitochondrial n=1 Tax=Carassius auratus TaxID=7957 RepID=A0A6P6P4W8_CARAU|nr:translation initiation factor IF-3, mitochondrial [Carassius auratus]XP_026115769.1 translation initiation factor IF-3, mitochondrial [Carassius auratus]XP_052413887.1 translation initiation factor IF-3, mitochondrial [Carassius gibelio]XP_052413888.1 translation initiation factor IF-3, mitochondrial [Carassius gibelio]XP_052423930.1 translation initiation factor IF-3, mitochondrial-like [Carassius gibelio]XP_052423942.1 translation initiation factor IF-3, mitochondrial-like [Carassius gibe